MDADGIMKANFDITTKLAKGFGNKRISNITKGIKNFGTNIIKTGAKVFPKAAQMVTKTTKAAGTLINQGKTIEKNTGRRALVGAKRFIGKGGRKL